MRRHHAVTCEGVKADRFSWIWLALLCLFGVFHSAIYALTNPVFESPDEPGHLGYVNRIAAGKGMPDQYDPKQFLAEGHQSPLYYFLAGGFLLSTGGPISVELPPSNTPGPAPYFDHRPDPFRTTRDYVLFFTLRLIGCCLVGLAVLQTGRAARKIMPLGHVWLVAPLLVATIPQVAFIGASISNDVLVILMGACVACAAAYCATDPDRRRNWIALGAYVGLAFLAKKNAIVIAPAAFIFVGCVALSRTANSKRLAINFLVAVGVAFLFFLPLLLRNNALYHEPLGNQMEMDTMPNLVYPQSLRSWHFRYIVPHVVPVSFLAQFGWMVVEVKARYVWPLIWAICFAASLGVGALFDRKRFAFTAFCFAVFFSNAVGLVYYNLLFPQAQGRLLFPSLACLALLCALGLHAVTSRIRVPYKSLAFLPLVVWLLWFDLLCFYTNENFYAWFGPKLGL